MVEVTDSMKDKIRKLLAKASNTACTVEEAKTFNDKAFELMEKFNLDRASLEQEEEDITRTHRELQVQVRPWSSHVLHGLCRLYYCKWFYKRAGRTDTVIIVGEESNVSVCHAIAVMILRAIQQEARFTGGGRSFMTGAGATIYHRCYVLRPKEVLEGPKTGTALVVFTDHEEEGNKEYIRVLSGGAPISARKSRAKVRDAASYHAGAQFGQTLKVK